MRLLLDKDSSIQTVRSYTPEALVIGANTYPHSCIVWPAGVAEWQAPALAGLQLEHMQAFLELKPQVVVLGVNERSPRAPAALRRAIEQRGIALETMELGAACRTYNVLATEGRAVAAGFILGS